jgi:hypothetical protein
MGAGISIASSGKVERQLVASSLLTPPQAHAEDLIKRRFGTDPDGTLKLLRRLQHALSVKVSLAQAYARSEWSVHKSEDGTMREYFLYAGPPPGMEAAAAVRAASLDSSAAAALAAAATSPREGGGAAATMARAKSPPTSAAGAAGVNAVAAPAPPQKGDRSWKRKPAFGPFWDGEGLLDAGWNLVLALIYLDEALVPSTANRYARALTGAMLTSLEARQSLADVPVFSLLESDSWDRLEALVRSNPSAADAWGMQASSPAQGLSVLQYSLCRGAPASVVRLIISAHPGSVDEKTRSPGKLGPCLPLWQACRDIALGQPPLRSTDPLRPAPLAVQREVFIGNPLQCITRGPDKAVPLEDASPQFLFDRRVLECIAAVQCPRIARRLVGGCLPLEAAMEVEGMSVEDITKLVWVRASLQACIRLLVCSFARLLVVCVRVRARARACVRRTYSYVRGRDPKRLCGTAVVGSDSDPCLLRRCMRRVRVRGGWALLVVGTSASSRCRCCHRRRHRRRLRRCRIFFAVRGRRPSSSFRAVVCSLATRAASCSRTV